MPRISAKKSPLCRKFHVKMVFLTSNDGLLMSVLSITYLRSFFSHQGEIVRHKFLSGDPNMYPKNNKIYIY